jgi:two-component system NtrC family sensor kinase
LRNSSGRVVGAIETLQDITARKKAEEALLKAKAALNEKLSKAYDQLVQTEKLVSVGQLAAGVAQEINSPVAYIYSNFGTLEQYISNMFGLLSAYQEAEADIKAPNTLARLKNLRTQMDLAFLRQDIPALMRESKEGIIRVRKIVRDLKNFSHVDANPQWLPADLNQSIETTLNIIGNEIRLKADIIKDYDELPAVQCLAPEINQVIMNLVNNAADAIGPKRGKITLRTGSDAVNAWIDVEDNGSGIPEESLTRIFDPFYTTKPVGQGTGLGLSISYGIVKKHHGRIKVHTAVGAGTRFRVILPIEQPTSQATMPAPLI